MVFASTVSLLRGYVNTAQSLFRLLHVQRFFTAYSAGTFKGKLALDSEWDLGEFELILEVGVLYFLHPVCVYVSARARARVCVTETDEES